MTTPNITLADIAREAGVSTSTVSRALADSPLISAEVKNMIKTIAKEKNYQINRTARNLRLRKTGIIAVVIPIEAADSEILSNPFILEFLGAVGNVLREFGYDMLLMREKSVTRELLQSKIGDGFIQLSHNIDPTALNSIVAETPFVVWGPPIQGQQYASVGINNRSMARQATEHLIQKGRERIGIIIGDMDSIESHQRFAGYQDALTAAKLPYDESLLSYSHYNPAEGKVATEQLLQQRPDIDAIFVAHSDMVAIMTIEVLRSLGCNVPDDVAVIGFDNISMGEYLSVPLTTISQNIQENGALVLVETLIKQMEGQAVQSITLSGELIVRESCGGHTNIS